MLEGVEVYLSLGQRHVRLGVVVKADNVDIDAFSSGLFLDDVPVIVGCLSRADLDGRLAISCGVLSRVLGYREDNAGNDRKHDDDCCDDEAGVASSGFFGKRLRGGSRGYRRAHGRSPGNVAERCGERSSIVGSCRVTCRYA